MIRILVFSFLLFLIPFSDALAQKKKIKTVSIGKQKWMAENLDVAKFQNGDVIPKAKSDAEWISAGENKQPAWCIDPLSSYSGSYGRLYNWYAVNDQRKICPKGYHVATDSDWTNLAMFFGGEEVAGEKIKSNGWSEDRNITNKSNFKAYPGAVRIKDGVFTPTKCCTSWWSSTADNENFAFYRSLSSGSTALNHHVSNKANGFYVRCVKD